MGIETIHRSVPGNRSLPLNSHAQYGNWNIIHNLHNIIFCVELPRAVWELKHICAQYHICHIDVELPRAVWELKQSNFKLIAVVAQVELPRAVWELKLSTPKKSIYKIGWTPTRSMGIETSIDSVDILSTTFELPRAVWELKPVTVIYFLSSFPLNSHAQYGNWNLSLRQ